MMPTTSAASETNPPKTIKKIARRVALTPRYVAALKAAPAGAYYVSDAVVPGLQIRVSAHDSSKSYSVRYRDKAGNQKRYTLGREDVMTLADARKRAKDALKQAAAGHDPQADKVEDRAADTMKTFAETYLNLHARKHKKSWRDDKRRLDNEILPVWKNRLVKDITRHDAQALIDDKAEDSPISANRLRSLLHRLFEFALQRGVVDVNVITATQKPGKEQQRARVLSHDEIRQFWKATDALPLEMKSAWRLRLITGQRKNEIHNATWNEIDTSTGWWTIPAERSKNALAHRIWLSSSALEILRALKQQQDARLEQTRKTRKDAKPQKFILAGARGKRQQREAAETFGIPDFHGHDLRRTAASLMTGSGTSRLIVSKILNHAEEGVTAIYDRHSYDAEKQIALDQWARTLTAIVEGKSADVLAFQARG